MWQRLKRFLSRCLPDPETLALMGRSWRVAGWLLLAIMALSLLSVAPNLYGLLGVLAIFCLLLLAAGVFWLLLRGLARLSGAERWGLLLLVVPLAPILFDARLFAAAYLTLLICLALIAVGVRRLVTERLRSGVAFALLGGLPLLALSVALVLDGWRADESLAWEPPAPAPALVAGNPALPGSFAVLERSYGSGSDPHRPAYGAEVSWTSEPVDGSLLLDGWEGLAGWARSGYWDASADALPVQGRVWLPDGDGPFPIVLIVHGNHEMSDYSDVGYGYLGELFASRGFITVSVDENFLNSGLSDLLGGPVGGLEEESDARAWLLLEHLKQWRTWTADPGHPMYGKADLDAVVLIGHSRGGEAVSEAAVFNSLERYPDDGTLAFDYGFGLRGVIAIAPVDHQYNPRDLPTTPADLSYLVVHGSHDSDVDAYVGSALYARLRLDGCSDCFKAGVYLLGANHGQFNTSWGAFDSPQPYAWLLNTQPLLDGAVQREAAKVFFSAFLEAVVNGKEDYRRFLARPELGAGWLPEALRWLNVYRDARQVVLADYEEDAALSRASAGGAISTTGLTLWREAEVPLRWNDQDSAAVLIGWTSEEAEAPSYAIAIEDSNWLRPRASLAFAAAMGAEAPGELEDFEPPASLDFLVELEDAAGNTAQVPISRQRLLYAQVDPVMYKFEVLAGGPDSEVVFQRYSFALEEWRRANPALDISSLVTVRFLFPKASPATVWLDDVVLSPEGY